MGKVLCFGELLLRLSPPSGGEWIEQRSMPVFVGGAELNVAQALAKWEIPVAFSTAIPDHWLSQQIVDSLAKKEIDTSVIQYRGNRIGTYYLPVGSEMKNAGVIYDRAGSSFAELQPGQIDWAKVFAGVDWFHFSAICPAVSQGAADVCEEALAYASSKGITISLDLNYRAKLWKYGIASADIMPALARYCNLIMGNIWAANLMLNVPLDHAVVAGSNKESYIQQAINSSSYIISEFSACKAVANTFRFDDGRGGVQYYTTLYKDKELHVSAEYKTDHVVDKVGSGDCFMAGLIYGSQKSLSPSETLEFATAAAFQKLFITGDATDQTAAQVFAEIKKHELH
ncbi:MAG: sugar kinase [Chitinophagaceae bacterium]|nr:MAG: sugar kinase [Chitinophagaceae bacterium]